MAHVLEWKDSPMMSELRWGIRKGPNSPISNSTRLAIITRDSNTVTDKGSQTQFKVEMMALYKCDPPYGQMTFDTLGEAKQKAMVLVTGTFLDLSSLADKQFEALKEANASKKQVA